MAERILIVSHGHPHFSVGGAENAAYEQYLEMRRRGLDCYFLARVHGDSRHSGIAVTNRSTDGHELLLFSSAIDHFRHSQLDKKIIHEDYRALLKRLQPAIIHFHHFAHLGVEFIRETRHTLPNSRIVLTLHEFLAICHAQGQMLKTSGMLCELAAPIDCNRCFPAHSPQEFFLREQFLKSFLQLCDLFICPSRFLQQRYVAWGLPFERTVVLENGLATSEASGDELSDDLHERFTVLGQLSALKGTLLLLQAAHLLSAESRKRVRIEIHGAMDRNDAEFVRAFNEKLEGLREFVSYAGPYRYVDAGRIIQRGGWVVQPSIWWENSPLVIQEAFAASRPVICSDIGGMKEKVADGVDGLHFRVSSAADLARTIDRAAADRSRWERLRAGISRPRPVRATVDALLARYQPA